MPWRMLEYMARLASTHRLDLWSVVFYVGQGAGAYDTGQHQVQGPAGTPTLTWQYQVIRLWQIPAEALLALGRPALLALVGQTYMAQPEVVLPQVVARLRQVPESEQRSRLLTALLALLRDEEMVIMVERLLEDDALLLDTPYLRQIRAEGHAEGHAEGVRSVWRRSILEALAVRFALSEALAQQVAERLQTITDAARLERLFAVAMRSTTLAEFQAALATAPQG